MLILHFHRKCCPKFRRGYDSFFEPPVFRIIYDHTIHFFSLICFRVLHTVEEYIIESVLHQKVTAVGNPLMLVQFRKQLRGIEEELKRLTTLEDADEELFTPIRTMLEILNAFAEERNYERRKKEKAQK